MNSFGKIFKITLYGTSHGKELGILIDGCPVGIPLSEADFTNDIERRKPKSEENTARLEKDKIFINSGVYQGFTDGTPILLSFKNEDCRSEDYEFDGFFRPGTADFTAYKKYKGFNNPNGGGMFSGRMTLALVAAGVVAKKIFPEILIKSQLVDFYTINNKNNIFNNDIEKTIELAKQLKTSVGGSCNIFVENIPIGLGEPFFDSVESLISHAIFSIPGVVEISFANTNKEIPHIIEENGRLNIPWFGINGGITNGNGISFSVKFHPPASIAAEQKTYNYKTKKIENFIIKGRHDLCYLTRTPIVVEAMTAIVFTDLFLISKIYNG